MFLACLWLEATSLVFHDHNAHGCIVENWIREYGSRAFEVISKRKRDVIPLNQKPYACTDRKYAPVKTEGCRAVPEDLYPCKRSEDSAQDTLVLALTAR
jgi:hypothetical protein